MRRYYGGGQVKEIPVTTDALDAVQKKKDDLAFAKGMVKAGDAATKTVVKPKPKRKKN
jgi:hypothetical protein